MTSSKAAPGGQSVELYWVATMRNVLAAAIVVVGAGCGAAKHDPAPPANPAPVTKTAPPPAPAKKGFEQVGMASWYGPGFAGRPTANGERFDPEALTAAHRTLPFGTRVRVTNLDNGKSVVVRINDRGPYAKNRIIDLSKEAARQIAMIEKGHVKVRVEVLATTAKR